MVSLFDKDMSRAGGHIKASLDLSRQNSDVEMVALSLLMLGNIALWEGRMNDARAHLRESLEIMRMEGSSRSLANLLESLAAVAAAEGPRNRARTLGGRAEGVGETLAL